MVEFGRWIRTATLGARGRRVLREILLVFATGHSPDAKEIANRSGLSIREVRDALKVLETRDFVALRGDEVRVAYPFTADDVPHEVVSSWGVARANCAIDALGVGTMLGETIKVRSRCSYCGAPIRLQGMQSFEGIPENSVVFIPPRRLKQGKAVESICPSINFYCNEEHGRAHVGASAPRGRFLSLDEATAMGIAGFGRLLDLLK